MDEQGNRFSNVVPAPRTLVPPIITAEQARKQGITSTSLDAVARWHDDAARMHDAEIHNEIAAKLRAVSMELEATPKKVSKKKTAKS